MATPPGQVSHHPYCLDLLTDSSAYYARAPGALGWSQSCARQEFLAIVTCPTSCCVQQGGKRIGNSPYCVSCLPVRCVLSKAGCDLVILRFSLSKRHFQMRFCFSLQKIFMGEIIKNSINFPFSVLLHLHQASAMILVILKLLLEFI